MRILLLDIASAYTAQSPYETPLGGTQAAACYLGAELAIAGAEVVFVNQHQGTETHHGVTNAPPGILDNDAELKKADAVILNGRWNSAIPRIIRKRCAAPIIGWMHEACFNDPHVLPAPQIDGYVFVSEWQRQINAAMLPDAAQSMVIPNGIAPLFHMIEPEPAPYPIVAYSGSSKRGLLDLPALLPMLHDRLPGMKFQIFSDCVVSQNDSDTHNFKQQLLALPNVIHVGAVPQAELPFHLAYTTFFISPNTYPETFCIALAEAMAMGLYPIVTNRAALPQTAAGFAHLIPVEDPNTLDWKPDSLNVQAFADDAVTAMDRWLNLDPAIRVPRTEKQIAYARSHYNWANHAKTWLAFLKNLRA